MNKIGFVKQTVKDGSIIDRKMLIGFFALYFIAQRKQQKLRVEHERAMRAFQEIFTSVRLLLSKGKSG
jgi:preprotein translocase subunit YajC